jgi:hypothetical protein
MKIKIKNGLPVVSINLTFHNQSLQLDQVLLDTGCSTTIFDTDKVESIGLEIDFINGRSVRMFGVGGQSELCYQQVVTNLSINNIRLNDYTIQLGITKETYGFDAILGTDILSKFGLKIDFENLIVF